MTTRSLGSAVLVLAASYLLGSVPFAQLMSSTDLRRHRTGTVSASGLQDVAGVGAVVVAGLLDVAKGVVSPLVARRRAGVLLAAAAGSATIAGHNWSLFLHGAGGRGLSPAMGTLLVVAPEGTLVLLGGVAAGRLGGETAIGALFAYAALVPVLTRSRGCTGTFIALAVLSPVLVKRLTGNRRATAPSTYLWRLLLDRDQPGRSSWPSES